MEDHQSLFGESSMREKETHQQSVPQTNFTSIAEDNVTSIAEEDESVVVEMDCSMGENEQESPEVPSDQHKSNVEDFKITSPFSLFAPSIQSAWASDLQQLAQTPKYAHSTQAARRSALLQHYCKRYKFLSYDEIDISNDMIPFDLLKELITKFTEDANFAIKKARLNARNEYTIPEPMRERAATLSDLPLHRQKVVKHSLLNRIPYPGIIPPDRWARHHTDEELGKAPDIDSNGLDTFLRVGRALTALGLPTYVSHVPDPKPPNTGSYSLTMEPAIWTDLGREQLHDWRMKAGIIKTKPFGTLKFYLDGEHHAFVYFGLALQDKLWSLGDFRLYSKQIVPGPNLKVLPAGYDTTNLRKLDNRVVEIQQLPEIATQAIFQMDLWTKPEIRQANKSLQAMISSTFADKNGTRMLCEFPNFMMITCGGGLERTTQQILPSVIINAISYDGEDGFSHRSCLYKLKIVWRLSSAHMDSGSRHETRNDDCQIYDSERYQTLLGRSQSSEESQEEGDDNSWTLENSPIDHRFVVFYQRVGSQINEEGFFDEWEVDPEVQKMYPERGVILPYRGGPGANDSRVLPDA